jgi:hypothetical protein
MPYSTVRRSGRISKQVPIVLTGSDAKGRTFSERTTTVVLSKHGAGILSQHKLIAEQELSLLSLDSNREADIRVVGEIGEQGSLHAYGVAFLQERSNFWQINFPEPPLSREILHPLELICSACRSPVTLSNGDFELDVCTIHGGLVRYCDQCSFATIWKLPSVLAAEPESRSAPLPRSPYAFEPEESAYSVSVLDPAQLETEPLYLQHPPPPSPYPQTTLAPVVESLAESMGSNPSNRRIHRRAKVSYLACIRSEAFGDDIVSCLDMSRGGLGFKSERSYLVSAHIRIAVPFSRDFPDAPAIFVPAKIVSCARIPNTEFYRCGAQFLRENS